MKKIIIIILLLIPVRVYAVDSYVVMDSDSNRVLFGSNIDKEMLIASTTKIMTALIAIENYDATKVICAGSEIKEVYGSMIYLEEGECLPLYDLLVGLMSRSGNDAANVIATQTLGYDKFIKAMNNKAKQLGMNHTHFENPHGLDDTSKNTSSAKDMALLMSYATKNKVFMEITKIREYKTTSTLKSYLWHNKNKLLSQYKYATGGKIGYTTRSGHIFVSSASRANENLVVVTFRDDNQFVTHKNLYEKAFNTYDKYKILDNYTFSLVEDYYKDYYLYIKEDLEVMLKKEELSNIDLKIELVKKKQVDNYQVVGKASAYIGKEYLGSTNIYAKKNNNKIKIFSLRGIINIGDFYGRSISWK